MENFDSPGKNVNPSRGELSNCSYLSQTYDLLEAPMQPLDKKQQTKLWQQNQYLADSGIQSAMTTHTPSINSKLSLEEIEPDESILSQTSGPFVQAWSSSGPMSVYPSESCLLSPGTPSASSGIGIDHGSEVPGIGCSRSDANLDARGNKLPDIDTDEAEGAIPDLVRLIKDEDDQVVIYQASMMVFQLSKSEAIDALIQSKEMISCILSALNRTEDPETVRFLAGTLYNMSQTQTGLKEIFLASCVPCLVNLLNSPIESVLFYAITTLHNLLLHQEGAKNVVRQSGCLRKLTSLLQKNNIKFLTICTDCLQILALGHQESKLQILSGGGPAELIRILRIYQYEKLLWTTARVLKVLSVCTANKPVIIETGGMEALAKHLLHPSPRLVLNCLWTLRNLSDAATRLNDLQPLLQTLVQLLGSSDVNIVTCAAGILSNLTCNNSANKLIVFQRGGLRGLLHALEHSNAKEEILEPCMCALRHLTSRHEEEEKARSVFVLQLGGLVVVSHILHAVTVGVCPELGLVCQPPQTPFTSWTLLKAIVGLLRNLSMNTDNHCPLRESGIVSGLSILLYAAQFEMSKRKPGRGIAPQNQTIVQNVRLEEIVEGICVAMHMLAREPGTRMHLSTFRAPSLHFAGFTPGAPGISIFVHLLYSTNDCVQRAAAGVLVEVAQDPDTLNVIASVPGVSARLDEMTRSRNEAISTYASALLIRLTEERKNTASPLLIPAHLDPLNTPPLAMDTGGGRMTPDFGAPPPHVSAYQTSTVHQTPQQQQFSRYPSTSQPYNSQHNPPTPMEPVMTMSPPPGSLMAMVGPPPPAYGCGPSPQPSHQHCYQQVVGEGGYSHCWNSYGSQCPSEPGRMYAAQHCEQIFPGGYSSQQATPLVSQPSGHGNRGVMPPCSIGGGPGYRGSGPGYFQAPQILRNDNQEYMDQQMPPDTCGPMTSPIANPKQHSACFSMDTSGYASPASEKLPPPSYVCSTGGGGVAVQHRQANGPCLQPLSEVRSLPPGQDEYMAVDSAGSDGKPGGGDRWFSSAQLCLP